MADYSKTIVTTVGVWGLAPPDLWGAFNWGAFKWGEGTNDFGVGVQKLIANSVTPDSTPTKQVSKLVAVDALVLGSDTARLFTISLTGDTLGVAVDMSDELLQDSEGYYHVFPDRTTSGEARDFTTWTAATDPSGSWASATVTATTWG